MTGLRRVATLAAPGALLCGVLVLGGSWLADRAHPWEAPAWRPGWFVPLRAGSRNGGAADSTWLVAVYPGCQRCVSAAWRRYAEWRLNTGTGALAALVVDTSEHPGADVLDALPPVPVWWDRKGVWRRRWGHRLYGEVIGFGPAGRYLGTIAPGMPLPWGR